MDRDEWDDLVDRTPVPPGLFQRFDSSRIDSSEGRQSSFVTVRNREGRLVGGARITVERRLPSRHMEMVDGPMFLPGYESEVKALLSKTLRDSVMVVDSGFIRPTAGYAWHLESFGLHRSGILPETIIVDLTRTEEELWWSVEHSVRQGIRKAKEHGLTVREVTTEREIERAYDLIERFGRDRHFAPISKSRLLLTHRLFHPVGRFHVLVGEVGENTAAVAVFEINNQKAALLVAASAAEYAKMQVTSVLFWESMRFSKKRGAVSMDFLGLPPAGYGLDGIRRFKLKWGGNVVGGEEYLEGVIYRFVTEAVRRRPDLFLSLRLQGGPFRNGIRSVLTQLVGRSR
jgi:peptidoglycan pentaglycine glycine transferase (the first glycine)